ncbi:restriction endonuclease subunit S [Planococcus plakortidis]|uniref:restriction endonuclease subunit S n=1 Tax=Planococcus plakortidis TaxID=1038856 RepID=UPI00385AA41E
MINKYNNYLESGYDWLGKIPSHWNLVKAKRMFKEESVKGYPHETLLSVLKGKGLMPREKMASKTVMAFKDLQNFKLVKKNDFVIHLRSFQSGFEMSEIKGIVSPAYTVFSGAKGTHPEYFKYLFYTKHFIDAIASTTQSLRDGKPIAYNEFTNMLLPLPSLSEQVIIANYLNYSLNAIDQLIDSKEKLIRLLVEKHQSVITEVVTKGLHSNVEMEDSGVKWIGRIPAQWEVKKIKYVTNLRNKKANSDSSLPFLGLENIESKTGKYLKKEVINSESTAMIFEQGDILFGKLRPYLTKTLLADFKGVCTSEILVLKTFDSIYFNKFLKYQLLSPLFIDEVNSSTYGTKMPRANWSFISGVFLTVPPLNEQKSIADYLEKSEQKIDNQIKLVKFQIEKLLEYRQSLIYEVVTGKIDVREMVSEK